MTKTEKASYQQSGFSCLKCHTHFKTYNGLFPDACVNCGAYDIKMEWNQHIDMTSTVMTLPLAEKPK